MGVVPMGLVYWLSATMYVILSSHLNLNIRVQQTGSHLFEICPSGNYFDYKAMAIGARSQSAKTYLEKKFQQFEEGKS